MEKVFDIHIHYSFEIPPFRFEFTSMDIKEEKFDLRQ